MPYAVGKLIVSCVLAACVLTGSPVQAQLDQLLKRVPRSANALVVIDVEQLMQSQMAQREGWKDNRETNYAARPLRVPPEAKQVAVAAELQPSEGLSASWQVALMSLSESMPIRYVARAEGGYVDPINGLDAAWTPIDAYIVQLNDTVSAVVYPGNRQHVARWTAESRETDNVVMSEYLQQAAKSLGAGTQAVLAVDLQDMLKPHLVKEALGQMESLKLTEEQLKNWTEVVTSVRGLTLAVDFSSSARGTVRFDFGGDVQVFGSRAKPLVLELLKRAQVAVPDLEGWNDRVESNAIVLEGPLSESGLRMIFSLLEVPTTNFSELKEETANLEDGQVGEPSQSQIIAASKRYYTSVSTLLDDLRKNLDEYKDYQATISERYARKIDALPILNVDKELLAWGAAVAETLRSISLVRRQSGLRAGVRRSASYANYGYGYYGNYGYGYGVSAVSGSAMQKDSINRQEQARASSARFQSWKQIEDATAEIRRKMTQKYNTEF